MKRQLILISLAGCLTASALAQATPALPTAVDQVVYARTFDLELPYNFSYRKERPEVSEGSILVLKVKNELLRPKQSAEPVLYVGGQTAERVNVGYTSGHLVVIVPGKVDLAKSRIWFGAPELPERVDAATVAAEVIKADKAGIAAVGPAADAALRAGGAKLSVLDRHALRRELASVVERYAPDESDLIANLRAERLPQ